MIKSYLKTGISVSLSFIILSLFSIFVLDQSIALTIHNNGFDKLYALRYITEYGPTLFGLGCLAMLCFAKPNSSFGRRIVLVVYLIAVLGLTLWVKTKLKIFFGRDWPQTWPGSHQSLISDNIFQFNILRSSTWAGSFPSGHATFMAVLACSMAILYPHYKLVWYLALFIIIIPLILLNHHFLGDCFAGIALGSFCAYCGISLYLLIKGTIQEK